MNAAGPQRPCATCPWLTTNHGRPHPDHWYTAANRARLWAGMRRGALMSCHGTDPAVPLSDKALAAGCRPAPTHAQAAPCAGALALIQRELHLLQDRHGADVRAYTAARPGGLTRHGMIAHFERLLLAGTLHPQLARVNLNLPVSQRRYQTAVGSCQRGRQTTVNIARQDTDLHTEHGEHRSTPPTTDGRELERYEQRIRAHLLAHARVADVANRRALFMPAAGEGAHPCVEVAGAQVYAYVHPVTGELRVSVGVDGAEAWLTRPDGTVPVVVAVGGTTVFDDSNAARAAGR